MNATTIIRMLTAVFAMVCSGTAVAVTADEVTSRAVERFGKSPSVTASFTVDAQGHSVPGTITVSGDRFHMDVNGMETWYDGRTQWTYSPSADEVSVTEPTAAELAQINPFAIVSSLRDCFSGSIVRSSPTETTVGYTPRNSGAGKLTVTYNGSTSWPSKVVIDNGQDVVTIKVKTVAVGKTPHPSEFVYNKQLHPGAEIVDLR